ncbi:hypothetical protein DFH09DRAFT_1079851 [Mycena vulgaris]|nr:hypothetical protein DFH09DRAFT_1079851 [Mycena vulgaris]
MPYNDGGICKLNRMASSNPAKKAQPHHAPFVALGRRTIVACSNCRKRKIRCLTTEQPPKNPCARCVKRHLPCEYLGATEPDYLSTTTSQTPEFTISDLPRAGSGAQTGGNPYTTPPTFAGGRGGAPPLPYTGPPPVTRTPTGWRYGPPSQHGLTAPAMHPGFTNPSFPSSRSTDPHGSTQFPGSTQPYGDPQYYAAVQANARYDPQTAHAPASQPTFMLPSTGTQYQSAEYPSDYGQWANDNYEEAPGPSSSSQYPSNYPRYN